MKVLVADDDPVTRHALEAALTKWGYEVATASSGEEAWEMLQTEGAPELVLLDWMMPGLDGTDICARLREKAGPVPPYVIMLTVRAAPEDIVSGLQAGANDYVVKPFAHEELRVRVEIGARTVDLCRRLAERVVELEKALSEVRELRGFLPICMYCRKIRDDQDYWQRLEIYISQHSRAQFTHGVCPECHEKHIKPMLEKLDTDGPSPAR